MAMNERHLPYEDETDRIFSDDERDVFPYGENFSQNEVSSMDEEEARAYSSVYDIPLSSRINNYKPKH